MGLKRALGLGACVALVVTAACGSDDDGPGSRADEVPASVERVEVDAQGVDPGWFDPIAIGDVLLADFAGTRLMSSKDFGESWQDASLPDAPATLDANSSTQLEVIESVAVMAGTDGQSPYVWTSANGLDWQGGRISQSKLDAVNVFGLDGVLYAALMSNTVHSEQPTPFELWRSDDGGTTWSPTQVTFEHPEGLGLELGGGEMWRTEDGQVVLPLYIGSYSTSSEEPDPATSAPTLVSGDDGFSWSLTECPIPNLPEWSSCDLPDGVPGLNIQYDQVSLDGGTTWQQPSFDDARVGQDSPPEFDDVVELPGGGWLATADNNIPSQDPLGLLARSDDGLEWEVLLPTDGRPSARVEEPVRFGDGWLVAFSVTGRDQDQTPSQLYLLEADGTNPRPIADTQAPGHGYDKPVVIGDMALVPESEDDMEGSAWLVRLTL